MAHVINVPVENCVTTCYRLAMSVRELPRARQVGGGQSMVLRQVLGRYPMSRTMACLAQQLNAPASGIPTSDRHAPRPGGVAGGDHRDAGTSRSAGATTVNRCDFRDLALGRSRRPRKSVRPIETASYA